MTQLNSQYDCANASTDLPELMSQLEALENGTQEKTKQWQDQVNHLRNQIKFIQNKCDLTQDTE
ncbi:DUF2524 domain-containing protein [Paenibacillus nanensis]|uniref:DUF2524 domain-containing protein n=1 Tax=Paenibacillus nanensis TaxID=393251 RepID=A0A3A1UN55_9BACL|nr:DUF2524 domain-containing protein [Paenibacillus nanensis]RIX49987.1 DUF2524 domain-containing protein [Paenibacillus nanensis]